jgi:transposase
MPGGVHTKNTVLVEAVDFAKPLRPYHPEQTYLLPPSPSDMLAEGHPAYFIAEIVDTWDVDSFYAHYEGDGRRESQYDPRMLLKVLVYGYASGVFSSRKIARKLEEDVAFRVLGAGNFPQAVDEPEDEQYGAAGR